MNRQTIQPPARSVPCGPCAPPPVATTTQRVSVQPTPESLPESVYDQRFLDRMRSLGYVIANQQLILSHAHETCRLFQLGESVDQVNAQMQARMGVSMSETLQLTGDAMLSYARLLAPRRVYLTNTEHAQLGRLGAGGVPGARAAARLSSRRR